MSKILHWTIDGADQQLIYGSTHLPLGEPVGVLILCHGFKGYKDYGFFPQLSEQASKLDLIAHRFNFSHSGMTSNIETFERADLFELDTWGKQIQDLHQVSRAIQIGGIAGTGLPQVWFGHSRGGVTVALAASRLFQNSDSKSPRPRGLVLAASPHQSNSLIEDQKSALRRLGRLSSPSSRTGQVLYVGLAGLNEWDADPKAYDPLDALQAVDCPVLVVHGSVDQTVEPAAATHLANAAGEHASLHLIEGASHTFDAPNPLRLDQKLSERTNKLFDLTCAFATECCTAVS